MTDRLETVLAAIDAANSADPTLEPEDGAAGPGRPAALLYGQRMSAELARIAPDASEHLRIAARGQHVERWTSPRSSYPEGRAGYLAWRKDLGAFHAERVGQIMAEAGYGAEDTARVGAMLRKEGIKRDPEVQMLEDVIALVFLRWYLAGFAEGRASEEVLRIAAKTARKMSAEGRARVRAEFALPEPFAGAFAD
ncbi:hypothetical protein LNKW23_38770 [Paralimibaculum aggregatum]|uniref:DUF4202 domain-containing protein n=1 Tax=Paralimibaculum aggregatum TaxID=3036245 RepID=A0ABQ6LN97_9RHOB|nr:DUF4202 domain-containing protein [Limibaculum sp. NKW23]GMG84661.1 hypothetical protein LNKW23_38770 [Limibaculum sp. NKW23]